MIPEEPEKLIISKSKVPNEVSSDTLSTQILSQDDSKIVQFSLHEKNGTSSTLTLGQKSEHYVTREEGSRIPNESTASELNSSKKKLGFVYAEPIVVNDDSNDQSRSKEGSPRVLNLPPFNLSDLNTAQTTVSRLDTWPGNLDLYEKSIGSSSYKWRQDSELSLGPENEKLPFFIKDLEEPSSSFEFMNFDSINTSSGYLNSPDLIRVHNTRTFSGMEEMNNEGHGVLENNLLPESPAIVDSKGNREHISVLQARVVQLTPKHEEIKMHYAKLEVIDGEMSDSEILQTKTVEELNAMQKCNINKPIKPSSSSDSNVVCAEKIISDSSPVITYADDEDDFIFNENPRMKPSVTIVELDDEATNPTREESGNLSHQIVKQQSQENENEYSDTSKMGPTPTPMPRSRLDGSFIEWLEEQGFSAVDESEVVVDDSTVIKKKRLSWEYVFEDDHESYAVEEANKNCNIEEALYSKSSKNISHEDRNGDISGKEIINKNEENSPVPTWNNGGFHIDDGFTIDLSIENVYTDALKILDDEANDVIFTEPNVVNLDLNEGKDNVTHTQVSTEISRRDVNADKTAIQDSILHQSSKEDHQITPPQENVSESFLNKSLESENSRRNLDSPSPTRGQAEEDQAATTQFESTQHHTLLDISMKHESSRNKHNENEDIEEHTNQNRTLKPDFILDAYDTSIQKNICDPRGSAYKPMRNYYYEDDTSPVPATFNTRESEITPTTAELVVLNDLDESDVSSYNEDTCPENKYEEHYYENVFFNNGNVSQGIRPEISKNQDTENRWSTQTTCSDDTESDSEDGSRSVYEENMSQGNRISDCDILAEISLELHENYCQEESPKPPPRPSVTIECEESGFPAIPADREDTSASDNVLNTDSVEDEQYAPYENSAVDRQPKEECPKTLDSFREIPSQDDSADSLKSPELVCTCKGTSTEGISAASTLESKLPLTPPPPFRNQPSTSINKDENTSSINEHVEHCGPEEENQSQVKPDTNPISESKQEETVPALITFGPSRVETKCPHCHATVVTDIVRKPSFAFGCCIPSYFIDKMKDVEHWCPQCQCFIGQYSWKPF